MRKWLKENGYEGDVNLAQMSDVAIVAVAQTLHDEHITAIHARDLLALKDSGLPSDIIDLITFVQNRTDLQDKFWRYLTLFSDTVSNKDEPK